MSLVANARSPQSPEHTVDVSCIWQTPSPHESIGEEVGFAVIALVGDAEEGGFVTGRDEGNGLGCKVGCEMYTGELEQDKV